MIIAGDIGGTKTHLALFSVDGESYEYHCLGTYPSQEYSDLRTIVLQFINDHKIKKISYACFAVAGPVQKEIVKATNLPWVIDANVLSIACHIPHVYLLNDLEANAYAIDILDEKKIFSLHLGEDKGNRAVCSPGTGLGEAGLYWDGFTHHPFACEGGHTELGPRNELELELVRFLIARFGHSSYERVLSGPGIHNLYNFFKEVKHLEEPKWLQDLMNEGEDPSAVISQMGLEGKSEICTKTLDLFCSLLGAETGNLALKIMATGGVYLGGGIPPKIFNKLKEPCFIQSFIDKGRFKSFLEKIPIKLILDNKAALRGSARYCRLQIDRKESSMQLPIRER